MGKMVFGTLVPHLPRLPASRIREPFLSYHHFYHVLIFKWWVAEPEFRTGSLCGTNLSLSFLSLSTSRHTEAVTPHQSSWDHHCRHHSQMQQALHLPKCLTSEGRGHFITTIGDNFIAYHTTKCQRLPALHFSSQGVQLYIQTQRPRQTNPKMSSSRVCFLGPWIKFCIIRVPVRIQSSPANCNRTNLMHHV